MDAIAWFVYLLVDLPNQYNRRRRIVLPKGIRKRILKANTVPIQPALIRLQHLCNQLNKLIMLSAAFGRINNNQKKICHLRMKQLSKIKLKKQINITTTQCESILFIIKNVTSEDNMNTNLMSHRSFSTKNDIS